MVVYVYEKDSNLKLHTFKYVSGVLETDSAYLIHVLDDFITVPKSNIKIVVYGF